MSGEQTRVGRYPMYVMLDVSQSMHRVMPDGRVPLDIFAPLVNGLVFHLAKAGRVAKPLWLSLLAFSDDVQVLRPMSPVNPPGFRTLPRLGRETNYVAALEFLADRFDHDRRRIEEAADRDNLAINLRRPLVFIVTDGAPFVGGRDQSDAEWQRHRDGVVGRPTRARIAVLSIRERYEQTLWTLATGDDTSGQHNAFIAEPGLTSEKIAVSVRECILNSIFDSMRRGELVIRPPAQMRRVVGRDFR